MKYVALLRGINVGGKTKVEMKRLKACFEQAGCSDVTTYINSGNVIFSHPKAADFAPVIEAAIKKEFSLDVPVIVRSQQNIEKLCQETPDSWVNNTDQKTDVLFLWKQFDTPDVLTKIKHTPEIERLRYIEGAVIWNIDRANATKGSTVKIIGTEIYKYMTIRNINTVRRLRLMMRESVNS